MNRPSRAPLGVAAIAVLTCIVVVLLVAKNREAPNATVAATTDTVPSIVCGKGHYGELRHLSDGTVQVCRR